jgi:hypothetical protein
MSEPHKELRDVLEEVHEVLEGTPELSDLDRQELTNTLNEIRSVLEASDDSLYGSLVSRLRSVVESFEDRHPKLTEIVGRVADSLADLGI